MTESYLVYKKGEGWIPEPDIPEGIEYLDTRTGQGEYWYRFMCKYKSQDNWEDLRTHARWLKLDKLIEFVKADKRKTTPSVYNNYDYRIVVENKTAHLNPWIQDDLPIL